MICTGLTLPPNYKPSLEQPLLTFAGSPEDLEGEMKYIAPFVACGDLSCARLHPSFEYTDSPIEAMTPMRLTLRQLKIRREM